MSSSNAVIQQPHSLTNPSDKYRVVLFDDWVKYVDGVTNHLPVISEHDNYNDAVEFRTEHNYY